MDSSLEKLRERLTTPVGHPILLLGAGFSLGAINHARQQMPLGKQLVQELYDNVLTPKIQSILNYNAECDDVNTVVQQGDLRKFCTMLRDFRLEVERDEYITSRMKGCTWREELDFPALATYPWTYIFTLNMDDLVEKIYGSIGKKLNIWNRDCQTYKEDPKETTLVKLHGDVNSSIPAGQYCYILDEEEYSEFSSANNRMLQKFGEEYVSNDLIILGTQFQETDLQIVLNALLKNGCNNENMQYFFVSPESLRRGLANKIEEHENFHHIKMTNIEFLQYLRKLKIKEQVEKKLLLSNSFADWNQELQEARINEKTYDLYNGAEAEARDFFYQIDISRRFWTVDEGRKLNKLIKEDFEYHISKKSELLVTIHGEAYVGKTCLAMRLLTLCAEKGYQCFYTRNADLRTIEKVKEFLHNKEENSKIALCIENAALYYYQFEQLFNAGVELGAIVCITTSQEVSHKTKQHILRNVYDKRIDYYLNEKISYLEADDIYKKLHSQRHLGRLQSATTSAGDIKRQIRTLGDLVDVLWYAHEGRQFSIYFEEWYNQKFQESQFDIFKLLTFYASLGCEFSIDVLPTIAQFINGMKFDYGGFKDSFSEFWLEEAGRIRLRYVRLFRNIVIKKIPKRQKIEWLQLLMMFLAKRIDEREQSRNSLMFETASKVRNILKQGGIDTDDIRQIFLNVEKECQHLSYYWIQRCIICSKCEKFEDAANAITNAEAARKYRTYQIIHADAKNDMARGIWCIQNMPEDADRFFFRGRDMMYSLIEERAKYSGATSFSVHTYVNMSMKYYRKCKVTPDSHEWYRINEVMWIAVQNLPAKDNIFLKLANDYVKFCKDIGRDDDVKMLLIELKKKPGRLLVESDYDIDGLPDIE